MLSVCTRGLRVTQFQFSVCMYGTCGRIDNKADFDFECPIVISLWTHVNLVLSSLLQIDWLFNPNLCLLNDDSGLCISSMQKRMLFAGFTAAKKTIIQNWFTPHMCGKTYWIHSLLQIVTYECTTARINGAKLFSP